MKALLFLLTVLFAVWLWRRNRLHQRQEREREQAVQPKPSARAEAQAGYDAHTPSPMLACLQCGVHMPAHDMVQGQQGHYCSLAHCQASSDTPVSK